MDTGTCEIFQRHIDTYAHLLNTMPQIFVIFFFFPMWKLVTDERVYNETNKEHLAQYCFAPH